MSTSIDSHPENLSSTAHSSRTGDAGVGVSFGNAHAERQTTGSGSAHRTGTGVGSGTTHADGTAAGGDSISHTGTNTSSGNSVGRDRTEHAEAGSSASRRTQSGTSGTSTQPDVQSGTTGTPGQPAGTNEEGGGKGPSDLDADGYPEQKHAGKIGYGPQYNQGADFGDKILGLKEEIKGKVTRNPGLVHQGKERRTGELKHKEMEEDDDDPFASPEEKKAKAEAAQQDSEHKVAKDQARTVAPGDTEAGESQRKGEGADTMKHIHGH